MIHVYKVCKIVKLTDAKSRMVAAWGWGQRKRGRVVHQVHSFSHARRKSSRDLLYNIVPVVNKL